jgi:hypothetical protein
MTWEQPEDQWKGTPDPPEYPKPLADYLEQLPALPATTNADTPISLWVSRDVLKKLVWDNATSFRDARVDIDRSLEEFEHSDACMLQRRELLEWLAGAPEHVYINLYPMDFANPPNPPMPKEVGE